MPDVDEQKAEIERELNRLKKELKEAHEKGEC